MGVWLLIPGPVALTGLPLQEDSCPQFLDPSPLVIPMNYETDVTFQGNNLDTVKVGLVRRCPGERADRAGSPVPSGPGGWRVRGACSEPSR